MDDETNHALEGSSTIDEQVNQDERAQMACQHIFVVNSSPEFLDLLRELLQDERYNVTTTNYVPGTFDEIAALKPALLIIDLVVGKRAGWDLLTQLTTEAATHDLPVVLTSTDQRLLDRAEANPTRYGRTARLVKPFDLDVLLATIHDAIGAA
jgi:DNA-binding response OmpR family regulator